MTEEQLEKLADLISDKVIKYLDEALDIEAVPVKPFHPVWPMTPQEFFHQEVDAFGNVKHYDKKLIIEKQLEQLQETKQKLLEEEKYELLTELQEIYDKLKKEYENL